jgi:acyl-CoA synthetase (AMP-forming)/AMP-acid ligase II
VNPESTLAYLGAMYAGCVPVLVDDRMLAASGDAVFAKARAKAAWTGKGIRWDWPRQNGFPQIEGSVDPRTTASLSPASCTENDLATLMPTSGSTGVPLWFAKTLRATLQRLHLLGVTSSAWDSRLIRGSAGVAPQRTWTGQRLCLGSDKRETA